MRIQPYFYGKNNERRTNQRMNIRPLHDKILVKRLQEEEKTKGGSLFLTPQKRNPWKAK